MTDAVGTPIVVGARVEYRFKARKEHGANSVGGMARFPGTVIDITAKRVVVRLDCRPKWPRALVGRNLWVMA